MQVPPFGSTHVLATAVGAATDQEKAADAESVPDEAMTWNEWAPAPSAL